MSGFTLDDLKCEVVNGETYYFFPDAPSFPYPTTVAEDILFINNWYGKNIKPAAALGADFLKSLIEAIIELQAKNATMPQ